jgi:hypothetical protein
MKKLKNVKSKDDIAIGKSDFVIEHKKTKFSQLYKIDTSKIIGSGMQITKILFG